MTTRRPKKTRQASHATLARLSADASLTRREQRLILELVADPRRNQTHAAIRAGYPARSARTLACTTLKRVNVAKALQEEERRVLELGKVTAEKTIEEIARMAYERTPDIGELYDTKGNLKEIHQMTPEQRAMIQSVETVRTNLDKGDGHLDTVVKVKLWDIRASKRQSLELLARHLAILDNPEPAPEMGPVFIFPPGTVIDVHQ